MSLKDLFQKRKDGRKTRHIDCSWLVPNNEDRYFCCDIRSPFHKKGMDKEESLQEGCPYFHQNSEG